MRIPAVVIGGSITCLGALRSLARAGIDAFTIARPDEIVRRSRWYKPLPGLENLMPDDVQACLDALESHPAVLLPCSDHIMQDAVTLLESSDTAIALSAPPLRSLRKLIDKDRFAKLAADLDVPRPRTWMLADSQLPNGLEDSIFENAFLKPVDSQSFIGSLGVKAYRVTSRDDAQKRLEQISRQGFAVLLQEYIPGTADQHFFIDGFVDRHGSVKAMFARRRLRMHPADFGNSSCMVSVALEDVGDAAESLCNILDAVAYRGIFSAEFKYDERDHRFKIIEINTRPWWYVEFASRCGVNVCDMAYADALEEDVAPVRRYRIGKTLIYLIHDFRAWRDTIRRGRIVFRPWLSQWLTSWRPIFAWDDPLPALSNAATFLNQRLRKLVHRARRSNRAVT